MRHLQAGIAADEDAACDGGVPVALSHLVDGIVERDCVGMFGERQLQLLCAMTVDVATARHTAEVDGSVYYFCCPHCRASFVKDPQQYLSQTP